MKQLYAVLALFTATSASAQEYPTRPISLYLPFPAGLVDILARGISMTMEPRLGQRVLVINRPGGAETLAMTVVHNAPADGYSFNFGPVTPLTIQTHRMKGLGFTKDSFIPVCQTFENRFFVAVGPKSPFKDIASLVAFAKANPGKLRYTTAGVSSSPHLAGAELWIRNGVQLIDVPYAGEAPAYPHLLTGEVDLGVVTTFGVVSQKLRPLALFHIERSKFAPDVPTLAEFGHPIVPSGYGGIFVRAGTPAAIVSRLEHACREGAEDTRYRELAEKNFQQSYYLDRAAFTAKLDADWKGKAALIPTLKLPE
jgi:tripartite-type tricarboxylate transporter receptor subunit TctC